MKKVFLLSSAADKTRSYAAIVRRGGMPVDPTPILDTLPADIDKAVKENIIRENVDGADEVWLVGEEQPTDDISAMVQNSGKTVRNVLFESDGAAPAAPAAPAPVCTHAVCLIYKDAADMEMNFAKNFTSEEAALEYIPKILEALCDGIEGRSYKVAADKKSGYVALDKKLVCTAYLLPLLDDGN